MPLLGLQPTRSPGAPKPRGAGEILLNAISRDGAGTGYDPPPIQAVTEAVPIPVIALGGVGNFVHFSAGIRAAAAGNIFNFKEHSYPLAKRHMKKQGIDVR